jgi:hypothetical protein
VIAITNILNKFYLVGKALVLTTDNEFVFEKELNDLSAIIIVYLILQLSKEWK